MITVTYTSSDPKLAARVLQALGEAYAAEHRAVFTPPGQVEFFDQEAQRYKKDLATAEDEIKKFAAQQDGIAPHVERDIVLQKLSDFRAVLQQTKADLATVDDHASVRCKNRRGRRRSVLPLLPGKKMTTRCCKGLRTL